MCYIPCVRFRIVRCSQTQLAVRGDVRPSDSRRRRARAALAAVAHAALARAGLTTTAVCRSCEHLGARVLLVVLSLLGFFGALAYQLLSAPAATVRSRR